MAVHDEKDFVWHRAHQAAQKGQKHLGSEMALEHLKAQGTAVGQRRDEVATEALAAPLHHWGLALGPSKFRTGGPNAGPSRRPSGFGRLPAEPAGAGRGTGTPSSLGRLQGTAPRLAWPAFAAIGPKLAGSCSPPAGPHCCRMSAATASPQRVGKL